MLENSNNDTHQTEEPFGVCSKNLEGMMSAINKGFLTFCKRKVNALGKKCDRRHLLPNSQRLYNQDFTNPNKSD